MSSKPSPVLVGGAVAAVLVVGLAVWGLTGSDTPQEPAATPPPSSAPTTTAPTEPAATTRAPRAVQPRPVKDGRTLTSPVELSDGATANVTKIEKLRSEPHLPGEIAAPALRFTIRATAGDKPLNLARVVVNAYFGSQRTPAIAVAEPGGKPFEGRLASGRSATGVFVFNVPPAQRDRVYLEFSWSPDDKPVVLTGNVS